jgi:hypothetical protein
MLVKVNATLVTQDVTASLVGRTAELFDKDPLSATLLAKAEVKAGGLVEFIFDITKASDLDSPGELHPDLFVIFRNTDGKVLFRSRMIPNVGFLASDAAAGTACTTVDLAFERE